MLSFSLSDGVGVEPNIYLSSFEKTRLSKAILLDCYEDSEVYK